MLKRNTSESFVGQQAGSFKRVGAVVSPAGKYQKTNIGTPVAEDFVGNAFRSPFDQFDRAYTFLLDGETLYFVYIFI